MPTKSPKVKVGKLPRAGSDQRFQAEDDLRILRRAGEVKADPSRMKQAKALAAHESANLSKIAKSK